jgi:DNA-binding transcriptional ArsR family regulator
MMKDDAVFRALADASRRHLLDRLHARNSQTLGELCEGLGMTRQAVAKHLAILEEANLVSWKRAGRAHQRDRGALDRQIRAVAAGGAVGSQEEA